jgi:hypothetical protein
VTAPPPGTPQPALADPAAATLGWLGAAIARVTGTYAGIGGLAFATALVLVATFAIVESLARRVAPPLVAFAATVLAAVCSLDALHVGAGASEGFFFAALLAAFALPGYRAVAASAIVTALWCNASAAGILAPLFCVAFVLGAILDRSPRPERNRAILIAAASALATCATPAFARYPIDAWRAIALDNGLADLIAVAPAVSAPFAYYAGIVLTVIVALVVGARSARSGQTLAFVFALFLAFSQGAFVPFAGIAAAPVLAEAAARVFGLARPVLPGGRAFAALAAGAGLVVAIAAGVAASKRLPALAQAPAAAPFGVLARFAAGPDARGVLLCTKLAWCDVADRSYGVRVLADSRLASAPDTTIAIQRTVASAKKGWAAKARAAGIDAIFVTDKSGFATLLAAAGWRRVATDAPGAIFVRNTRETAAR